MIRIFSILVLFSTIALALAEKSSFELCALELYNRDGSSKCKLKSYDFDPNIPRMKDFIECVFLCYKWAPHYPPYRVQPDKMISDLKANGLNESDGQNVVTDCEKKYGRKISAMDYFLCLYNNPKTKEGIMNWLKVKDGDFFKKC